MQLISEFPAPVAPGLIRLPARLAILGSLLLVELLALSIWLDSEFLSGHGALAHLIHDWGAWTVRLAVALVLGSLIFAESKSTNIFRRLSGDCALTAINWSFLAAHAAVMLLFVSLSSVLFQHTPGSFANSLVLGWGCTGALSLALAACAVIPPSIWVQLFRGTADAWAFGSAAAMLACVLGLLAQNLWLPLSHWTLALVVLMLRPFVGGLMVDPSSMSIGTNTFSVEIAQQCSGYEGMGLILAFSSAWLWFFRKQWRFPQALLLLPAGVAIIWIANAARIAGLILIGNAGARQIALGGFHSQAGWIAFNIVAIGTCLVARRIPALVHHPETAALETDNPTAPYLLPFLAILAAAMISRALSSGFEWFYPLRVLAAAAALWYFRRSYRDLNWRFGWLGVVAGAMVFALWIAMEPRGTSSAPTALLNASSAARSIWTLLRILGGVVLVPIAEELAFRGFLLRRLIAADFESVGWRNFSWAAVLISSAAFGLLHGERWLAGTIAGVIFALVQFRRGRIGDAIAAHSVANALVAAWVLIGGNWKLW